MKLERTGEKLLISHRGISYKFSQDRYDLLRYLLPILIMLRDLSKQRTSIEIDHILKMDDRELLEKLLNNSQKKIEIIEENMANYKEKLSLDIKEIKEDSNLLKIEKDTYIANLEIMEDYLLQRRFNKALYHVCVDEVRDIMLEREVTKIVTPFSGNYMHLLTSIKNDLKATRVSSAIKISSFRKNDIEYLLLNNPVYI